MSTSIAITIGRRIRQAREMLGLSLRALAEKLDGSLSHTALGKYESGSMVPGSAVLIQLSRAMGQPVDYFFREFQSAWTSPPHFRRRVSKLSQREKNSLLERSLDFFERYQKIEEIMGEKRPLENPLPKTPAKTEEEVSRRAQLLRKEWNLGSDPLPNIRELMEIKGIKVHEIDTDNRAFDGFHSHVNGEPVVVVASWLNRVVPRKRMTEAHELAHVMLHLEDGLEEKQEENLVNRFAGELVLPEDPFRQIWGSRRKAISLGELLQIKAFFGASMMAIVYRASQLGLMAKPATDKFWKYASIQRWRTDGEPGDDLFKDGEANNRFRQLVLRAVMEEKISESRAAALLKTDVESLRAEFQETFA